MKKEALVNLGIIKIGKEEDSKVKDVAKGGAIAGGVGYGLKKTQDKSKKYFYNKVLDHELDNINNWRNNEKANKKIISKIKDLGTKVGDDKPGAFYDLSKDKINYTMADGPEGLAHELGHAINFKKGKVKGFTRAGLLSLGNMNKSDIATSAIGGSGVAGYRHYKDKDKKKAKTIRNLTLAGTGLMSLPLIYEEGKATQRGLNALKDVGEYTKGRRNHLLNALGTYGSKAIPFAATAGYFGADALKDKWKKRKEKKDEPNKTSQ